MTIGNLNKSPPMDKATPKVSGNGDSTILAGVLDKGLFDNRRFLDSLVTDLNHSVPTVFNVKGFGAKGDGLSDDTVAIQRALTAASIAGGTVYFPPGVYLISAPLVVLAAVTLVGGNYGGVTSGSSDTLGSVLKASSAALTAFLDLSNGTHAQVLGLRFLATNAANTTVGIHDDSAAADSSDLVVIRDCHFRYFGGNALNWQGGVLDFSYNQIRINNNGTGHCLHLHHGASDATICFNGIGSTDEVNGDGIFMDGATDGSQHCTIMGNLIFNCRYGINLTNASINNRIIGNRCEKHGTAGIRDNSSVAASFSGNLIEGNVCFNNGTAGIRLDACKNVAVLGNRCLDDSTSTGNVQDFGIVLVGAVDCAVIGNTCFDSTVDGIRLSTGSSRNLIADNYIRNIPQYGILVQDTCNSNRIDGNYIYLAGQDADNTYDGILLNTTCTDNSLHGNTIRHGGGAIQTRYGIRINSADCTNTQILDNDCFTAGRTGAISDAGTSTVCWHNRGFGEQGHQLYATDNVNDIGAAGATRPRSIYAGTSVSTPLVVVGTDPTGTDDARIGGTVLVKSDTDAAGPLYLRRNSATGRVEHSLEDQSGNKLWRIGLTAAGGTVYAILDATNAVNKLTIAQGATGALTFIGPVVGNDTDTTIRTDTSDASDSKRVIVAGGGDTGTTRGARVEVHGNEFASNGGRVLVVAGNVTGGDILFSTAATDRHSMDDTGHFKPAADNTYDYGTTALRPRVVYGYTGDYTTKVSAGYLQVAVSSPAQFTGNQDNFALGSFGVLRISTDASRDLTGLTNGVAGRELYIFNVGANNLVLKNDVTSTAANRFLAVTGADITLAANEGALCVYDATTQRWRTHELN